MDSLDVIGDVCYYILHPIEILRNVWNFGVDVSFYVCLVGGAVCIVAYALGCKKVLKYVPISLVLQTAIQAIGKF